MGRIVLNKSMISVHAYFSRSTQFKACGLDRGDKSVSHDIFMKIDEQKIILARKGRKVASIVNRGNERTVKIRAELFYAKICPVSSDGALRVRDGFHQGLSLRHAVQESFSDWSRKFGGIISEGESTTLFNCTFDVLGVNEAEPTVRK